MSAPAKATVRTVLSLAELLSDHPTPQPCLIEPGLLPSQGILFSVANPRSENPFWPPICLWLLPPVATMLGLTYRPPNAS